MARVWPGLVVEENNVQVHVSALRKVLGTDKNGESCIINVPGRGYRLIGVMDCRPPADEPAAALALPDKPSVAVLPFVSMSNDPEQEFFADGIADDVITSLSRYPSLFVIARNSCFTYKGRAVDVTQVGRELGVRYVLEGSLRKSRNCIRVTALLVEAESGKHVWAERYERDLADIFAGTGRDQRRGDHRRRPGDRRRRAAPRDAQGAREPRRLGRLPTRPMVFEQSNSSRQCSRREVLSAGLRSRSCFRRRLHWRRLGTIPRGCPLSNARSGRGSAPG